MNDFVLTAVFALPSDHLKLTFIALAQLVDNFSDDVSRVAFCNL